MKLLVDIGNSRVKWAILDEKGLNESDSFPRAKTGIKTPLNKAWKSLKDIESVFVANVAGDKLGEQLIEWCEKNWQITPTFVHAEKKRFGVISGYDEPEKLGIDRWLSLIVARQHARQAQCIIDCGTAMTIDIVTQNGQHQGGMILPGLSLMQSSLVTSTDALTEETDEKEFKTLATNTYSAIQAGTLYCISATLERIIADLRDSFNDRIRFIITGGDAQQLLPLLPEDVHHYPDIVLKGLAFYARQNQQIENAAQEHTETETVEATEHVDVTEDDKEESNTVTESTQQVESETEDRKPAPAEKTEKKPKKAPAKSKAKTTTARKPRQSKSKATAAKSEENTATLPEE